MSSGLFALLDDIAAIAKVAAASIDDVGAQAIKASGKAAGIVIDDTAVTPRYVVGFAAERELPIIGRIAWGSLKNKLIFLLPGALALSLLAPWAITPLLMLGGLYLCFEGYEKLHELLFTSAEEHGSLAKDSAPTAASAQELEEQRIAGAIRTDLILSAEIMAIALATVAQSTFAIQAVTLAIVGIVVTAMVYGLVAIIVKADDVGLAMAKGSNSGMRAVGRAIVAGMPTFLRVISIVGILAMLWVGGGIIVHGLAELGWHLPEDLIHSVTKAVEAAVPFIGTTLGWLAGAGLAGLLGAALGFVVERSVHTIRPAPAH
jgi:uncharacterized protein